MSFKEKDVKKYISISLWQVFYLFFLFFYFMSLSHSLKKGGLPDSQNTRMFVGNFFYSRHSRAAQTLFSRIKEFPRDFCFSRRERAWITFQTLSLRLQFLAKPHLWANRIPRRQRSTPSACGTPPIRFLRESSCP